MYVITAYDLCNWIEYLINNTFVTVGNKTYHQTIGIPMGTNCAVFLANFFLFTYELDFISRLITHDVFRSFMCTCRYIDDILSIDNPLFDEYKYITPSQPFGLYPQNMLNLEGSSPSTNVEFLDLRIHLHNGRYVTTIFDKRTHSKYRNVPIAKFPDNESFIPSNIRYNIVLSQAHRFLHRCSTKRAFVYHTARLLVELHLLKHYKKTKLFGRLRRFLHAHTPLYFDTHPSHVFSAIYFRFLKLCRSPPAYLTTRKQ